MSFTRKVLIFALVSVVISSLLTTEVEARRKILRGRKTITRTYYRGLEIPGFLIAILYAIGIIIVNGIVYIIANKWIIARNEVKPSYTSIEHEV